MKVIVSLTSWKKRIETSVMTIKSIMNQDYPEYHIELNLDRENFPSGISDLPAELVDMCSDQKLKIYWSDWDMKVWEKSVPTMRRHRGEDYVMIQADDDVIYSRTYISSVVRQLENFPECEYFNTQSSGIAGEYSVFRSSLLNKAEPYLTDNFIREVKVDDCCWLHIFNKFHVSMAPRIQEKLTEDRLLGYSFRREFSDKLPQGISDVSEWNKTIGEYPMKVLQKELERITRQLYGGIR